MKKRASDTSLITLDDATIRVSPVGLVVSGEITFDDWASIGPDLGLYMGRHLDPNGAYFADGIQHPEETLDLLDKIRTAVDEESKIAYSMELQKLIYDEYYLFGKVLYVNPISHMKYAYVMDDNFGLYTAASWTPENVWLDQ